MSATEQYLANDARYAQTFSGPLPMPPSAHVAVVACMDARLNVYAILGLGDGEAHVIRNAGGVITDDEIRSLAISQRLLGTSEIILIHHTDCGMLTFTDDQFKRSIQDETGIKPAWSAEAFPDLLVRVRRLFVTADNTAVAEITIDGTQADNFLAVANQEKQVDLDQAWMLTFTPDDRISAVIAYWDQNQLYRRLGVKRLDQITITAG